MFRVRRLPGNPVLRPGMPGLREPEDANLTGPSLVAAPDWLPGRLGRYHLYFAHHKGRRIRVAFADSPAGPFTVHPRGVLSLDETPARDHVASPDVYLDPERRLVRMYFHGGAGRGRTERTFVATSRDGLRFEAAPRPLGPFYFRVVRHGVGYVAVAKLGNRCGALYRSRRPDGGFRRVRKILPRMRHAGLLLDGDLLRVFFSRIGDRPESILVSTIDLSLPARRQVPSDPVPVLAPEEEWEGADLPLTRSRSGPAFEPVRQLRDPAVFEEGGRLHLLYTVAGEQGIAIGELTRD